MFAIRIEVVCMPLSSPEIVMIILVWVLQPYLRFQRPRRAGQHRLLAARDAVQVGGHRLVRHKLPRPLLCITAPSGAQGAGLPNSAFSG